jgi:peptidoglycan hydrolase-like protein with peptidoglycan-binding domain
VTAVVALAAAPLLALPATPAQAASTCTSAHAWVRPSSTASATAQFPEAGGSRNCVLGTWMASQQSQAVYVLQYSLWRCGGYLPLSGVDGYFGKQTKDALIKAQTAVKATPDGIYGAESAAKLKMAGREISEWGDTYRCHSGSQYTVRG